MQVRRTDQAEVRMRKWRKGLEDDIQAKFAELKQKLSEGVGVKPVDAVTRAELIDVAQMLKQELKKMVAAEAQQPSTGIATRKELAAVAGYLRDELASVERVAAAAHNTSAHQELTSAAEAVRAEMRTLMLTERASPGDALPLSSTWRDLEKANDDLRRNVADLTERMSRSERMAEDTRRDFRHLREDTRLAGPPQVEGSSKLEPAMAALANRIRVLEDMPKAISPRRDEETAIAAVISSHEKRLQVLEDARREPVGPTQSEVLSRLEAVEEQQKLLRRDLEEQASRPAELGEVVEEEVSDNQLMLLDLHRRVIAMERREPGMALPATAEASTANVSTISAPGSGSPVAEAAQLAQSLALNLRLARQVAGGLSARSGLETPPPNEQASPLQLQDGALPPVAALKVGASPRLQLLALSPRLPYAPVGNGEALQVNSAFTHSVDSAAMCSELRAEVAAVWDAVAELAELLGDGAPSPEGGKPAEMETGDGDRELMLSVQECKRSVAQLSQDVRDLKGGMRLLETRVVSCERKLQEQSQKGRESDTLASTADTMETTMATFDARAGGFFSSGALVPPVQIRSSETEHP